MNRRKLPSGGLDYSVEQWKEKKLYLLTHTITQQPACNRHYCGISGLEALPGGTLPQPHS